MIRVGTGFDAHRFAEDRKLVIGGVTIDHPRGLAGHSDADVLCHAIIDAILGADADSDIGTHFPNTDPEWKDACSIDLLKAIAGRIARSGAGINNVDATIIAEEPGMAPFIDDMRANIAGALGVRKGQVSVKATSVESMGALGRAEGIAVMAAAVIDTEG